MVVSFDFVHGTFLVAAVVAVAPALAVDAEQLNDALDDGAEEVVLDDPSPDYLNYPADQKPIESQQNGTAVDWLAVQQLVEPMKSLYETFSSSALHHHESGTFGPRESGEAVAVVAAEYLKCLSQSTGALGQPLRPVAAPHDECEHVHLVAAVECQAPKHLAVEDESL